MKKWHVAGAALLALCLVAPLSSSAAGKSSIVTFSQDDLARSIGQCGCQAVPQSSKLNAHRNTAGDLVYVVSEQNKQEGIVTAETGQCYNLSKEVLDVYRNDKGQAVAQIIDKDNMRMLMVGDFDPVRGRRFDVERSGVYFVVSHGTSSTLAAVEKPYRTIHKMDLDAQRMFLRRRQLMVVGGSALTGQLEARVLRPSATGLAEDPPIPVRNMPAGVKVLDYSEATDELLLGGVDASGQAAFVVYNLSSGASSSVAPGKPGDNMGLFVGDGKVRAKLGGRSAGASVLSGGKEKSGGILDLVRKKNR